MAAFVKHDANGNILSFGIMSKPNILIQKTRPGEKLISVAGVEKGFDKKYKILMDGEIAETNLQGDAKLQRRFDKGFPKTAKDN